MTFEQSLSDKINYHSHAIYGFPVGPALQRYKYLKSFENAIIKNLHIGLHLSAFMLILMPDILNILGSSKIQILVAGIVSIFHVWLHHNEYFLLFLWKLYQSPQVLNRKDILRRVNGLSVHFSDNVDTNIDRN